MPMTVSFTIKDGISPAIDRLMRTVTDWRPYWDDLVKAVYKGSLSAYQQQGPGWKPLKPSTLARRHAKGIMHDRILEVTGRMKRMATRGHETKLSKFPRYVYIDYLVPYAVYHQTGTRKMPARPFIVENEMFARGILQGMYNVVSKTWLGL